MTPLSRQGATAALAVALGVVGLAPALAQDGGTVRMRIEAADVVMRDGQALCRDPRGGVARVAVRRDRSGRLLYDCVLPRYRPWGAHGGSSGFDRFEYRPPARDVDCNSSGHCEVRYYDPYYDRRLYGGGHRGSRGAHRDDRGDGRDRGSQGDRGDRPHRDDD